MSGDVELTPELKSAIVLQQVRTDIGNALEYLTKDFNSGPSGQRAMAIASLRKAALRLDSLWTTMP